MGFHKKGSISGNLNLCRSGMKRLKDAHKDIADKQERKKKKVFFCKANHDLQCRHGLTPKIMLKNTHVMLTPAVSHSCLTALEVAFR